MTGRVQELMGKVLAAAAFLDPELIAAGEESVRRWVAKEERLAKYGHYLDDLFR